MLRGGCAHAPPAWNGRRSAQEALAYGLVDQVIEINENK